MAVKPRRSGNKNPPILSHEFIIQNHADIVACIAMVFVVGLIFQMTSPLASIFIALHHNTTKLDTMRGPAHASPFDDEILYTVGWKDCCAIFFYTLIGIVMHALVQEYILDKLTRKLHLSKIRHSKFNDAGQLLAFALLSSLWGVNIILRENYLSPVSNLWEGFPHVEMSFVLKFYMICQLSYWLHWIPEVYFLRMKKDEIPSKFLTAGIYFAFVAFAYLTYLSRVSVVFLVLHFVPEIFISLGKLCFFAEKEQFASWLFRVGNLVSIFARFMSAVFAVYFFFFGLEPYASQTLRYIGIGSMVGLQCYLLFRFAGFHARRLKGRDAPVASPKRSKAPKEPSESDLPEVDQNTRKQALNRKVKSK